MKKILICTQIKQLNTRLQNEENEIILPDIQYKEGILEALETKKANLIIIKEDVEGEITLNELVSRIHQIDNDIKIIAIIKEKEELKQQLINKNVDIIEQRKDGTILLNYSHQELKKELYIIQEILTQKIIQKDPQNNKAIPRIISIWGNPGSGKSILTALISKIVKEKRVLIIDSNFTDSIICNLFNATNKNNTEKEKEEQFFPYKRWIIEVNSKIDILSDLNKKIEMKEEIIKKLLNELKKEYEIILIDTGEQYIETFLKESDIVLYALESNLSQVETAKRRLSCLLSKIENKTKIKLIINKYNKEHLNSKILKQKLQQYNVITKISYNSQYNKIINKNMNLLGINRKVKREIKLLVKKITK